MLYIKNDRLYTQSFSFELPEDMGIVTDPPGVSPDTLIFETLDGKYQIEIGAWYKEESPEKQIIDFIEYASHVLVSDLIKVERGTLKGFGAHFRNATWQEEYYEERLQFKLNDDGQNTLVLGFMHEAFSEDERNGIYNFMEQPNIKQFLNSIRPENFLQ